MRNTVEALRRELREGLAAAKLDQTAVSLKLGRSKDYVGDFFRSKKASLGYDEIVKIKEMIRSELINAESESQSDDRNQEMLGSVNIHVELRELREAVYATLRSVNVPAVLAKSRVDDLLLDLKELSAAHTAPLRVGSVHIYSESEEQANVRPSAQASGQ